MTSAEGDESAVRATGGYLYWELVAKDYVAITAGSAFGDGTHSLSA